MIVASAPHAARRLLVAISAIALLAALVLPTAPTLASPKPHPTPTLPPPIVISFAIIPASRGAGILRAIYPSAHITVDASANALIAVAPADVEEGMRTIASGIDVKNPTDVQVDAQQLRVLRPSDVVDRVEGVFPHARLIAAPNKTVVIMAPPSEISQIKAIITTIDTPPPTPTPRPRYPAEAVRVTQRNPREVARAVAAESPGVRVAVSGSEILLSGPQDEVDHAKALVAQLDVPQMGAQYTELYHLHYVDAGSVADLLKRSFANLPVQVDADLNAITVLAGVTAQRRIADAIAQLDSPPAGAENGAGATAGGGASGVEVVSLNAAVPGPNGGPSSSATDLATTITQALQQQASGLIPSELLAQSSQPCYSQPFTLKSGTYFFGDFNYYNTALFRDVLVVTTPQASNANGRRRQTRRARQRP